LFNLAERPRSLEKRREIWRILFSTMLGSFQVKEKTGRYSENNVYQTIPSRQLFAPD
jgi:hypothetical protein